jgi:dihydrolipoamide dehydrogenase
MVMGSLKEEVEVAVIGAGPGGYVSAIRAADLGKNVAIVEARDRLGGTCLLEGCIPSKALINAVELAINAKESEKMGLFFKEVTIDAQKLSAWTQSVVEGLSKGINVLLEKRGVEIIHGRAKFDSNHSLRIEGGEVSGIEFKHCVIATGSSVARLPLAEGLPVWYSDTALKVPNVPNRLLVVGGGYIGLELGLVYAGLGSKVTVVEFNPQLLTGADADLVEVVVKKCQGRFEKILLGSKVVGMKYQDDVFIVEYTMEGATHTFETDQVFIAIGRKPNTDNLGWENTKIKVNSRGFIEVNEEGRTAESKIFAIGDVVPGPMLAHKAAREAKVAAEVIAGLPAKFDNRAIPAVVFTDPEIAWTGLSENEAKVKGINYKVGKFPLKALGRARTLGRTEGFAKIIFDPDSKLILGLAMVGTSASELIGEATLALEMGATLEDLKVTIHPHPTLSEAIMEAAEVAIGEPVHILQPKV